MVRSCLGQRTTAIKRSCDVYGVVVHQVPCRGRVTVAGAALARTYVVFGVISGRCRASPVMQRDAPTCVVSAVGRSGEPPLQMAMMHGHVCADGRAAQHLLASSTRNA
jgi:hypothetical protein